MAGWRDRASHVLLTRSTLCLHNPPTIIHTEEDFVDSWGPASTFSGSWRRALILCFLPCSRLDWLPNLDRWLGPQLRVEKVQGLLSLISFSCWTTREEERKGRKSQRGQRWRGEGWRRELLAVQWERWKGWARAGCSIQGTVLAQRFTSIQVSTDKLHLQPPGFPWDLETFFSPRFFTLQGSFKAF